MPRDDLVSATYVRIEPFRVVFNPTKNFEKRIKMYRSKYTLAGAFEANNSSPDPMYFRSIIATMERLEGFIRKNSNIFDLLD